MNTRIFAAEGIQSFFKRWKGNVSNPSTVVNTAVERYNYLLLTNMPSFSVAEWGVVFDLVAEYGVIVTSDIANIPRQLIQDTYMREDLLDKWEIDAEEFCSKLLELSTTEVVALVDIAERYLITNVFEGVGLPFKSRVVQ